MRVGITTATAKALNVWANGITQNVIFLALLLRQVSFVTDVLFIDAGDAGSMGDQVDLPALGLRLVPLAQCCDLVDVVIELGGALPLTTARLLRARGKKLVYCCVAQPYANLVEMTVFDRPGHFQDPTRFDQVWLLPKDTQHIPMVRTLYRCPVAIAPYLWDPMFVRRRQQEIQGAGLQFDFAHQMNTKPKAAWRIAVFEPNLSPIKTCIVPMLVVDLTARARPAAIDHLYVMNSDHLAQHGTMLNLARSLDLVRNHRATFLGRHDVAGFMAAQHVDAVVSHQWGNEQNYLYLDVLYGGYPLVHNSHWLRDYAYHYADNQAQQGAQLLLQAFDQHATNYRAQQAANARLFAQLSPTAEPNVRDYARLLHGLVHNA